MCPEENFDLVSPDGDRIFGIDSCNSELNGFFPRSISGIQLDNLFGAFQWYIVKYRTYLPWNANFIYNLLSSDVYIDISTI